MTPASVARPGFRRAVAVVATLNLAYFVVEFGVARIIGSVGLVADSIDFLEDGALNIIIVVALTWTLGRRARLGHVLALVILLPAAATVVMAVAKILDPTRPPTLELTVTATGALIVNLACAAILVRHRHTSGSLASAAWLSARNDAVANLAILAAAVVALGWHSGWPDIVVGLGIGALNADAGRKVWRAASAERLGRADARA